MWVLFYFVLFFSFGVCVHVREVERVCARDRGDSEKEEETEERLEKRDLEEDEGSTIIKY